MKIKIKLQNRLSQTNNDNSNKLNGNKTNNNIINIFYAQLKRD